MSDNYEDQDHGSRSRLAKAVVLLLCAIPLLSTIVYGAVDSWAIALLGVIVAVIALLWIADTWSSREFRFGSSLLLLPVLGVIVLSIIQLLPIAPNNAAAEILNAPVANTLSMDPYSTRLFLMRAVILFVFFAAALAYIPGGSRAKKIAILIVAFGAFAAFFGIIQRLAIGTEAIYGLRETPQAIPFGPFVNQHHFAALMEMTSGVALGMFFGSGFRRDGKIFLAIAAGIMGMAVAFTGSRGGMISYLGVVIFVVAASFVRKSASDGGVRSRNLLVAVSAIALIFLVIGSVSFLGGGSELLRGIGVEAGATDVTSGRSHFWSVAWMVFLDHPILGAGFDAFGAAFSRYDTWSGFYRVEQVHNDYLQMLADGGLLGFACVAAFVALLIGRGISAIGQANSGLDRSIVTGALAGCFGILIHSFFDFPLRTTANAFFFLLLVVLATETRLVRSKRRHR
ncbi:MAG TPA: O-antigen ligase family protein [Pyrinomonadaceae bacterium]|nr:O-antigen ligase family protein [Pyrinomonadaceae bacterium]